MVAAAFAALTAMLWPALTGKAILAFRDMLHNYGPMRELFWSGTIDLWNDREFGGSSVLADIVQQPFYLGELAMRALHAPAWPGIPIRVWAHSLGGMIGMYALLRRTTSRDAAAMGAVVIGLCGFSIADFSNPQWACAAMWVPIVLLASDLWAVEGGATSAALLALSLPQMLVAGGPLRCCLPAAAAVGRVWLRRRRPARRLAWEGAAIAGAVQLVAAPQVVSSLRALSSVARGAGLPREIREQWSLHPARIAELFVPRMFGPLFDQGYWGGFTVSPPWTRNYIHSIYAGVIGPGLLAAALWRRRREATPWLVVAGIALALSLGPYFFHLFGVLGELLPGFRVFRYPQRLMALFMPAWAALMALGAAEIVQLPVPRRVALAAGSALLATAALLGTAALANPDPASLWRTGLQIAVVGAASCAALLLPARLALPALAVVLIADLAAANAELLGMLPRGPFRAPPAACDALAEASGNARRSTFRVYVDQDPLEASPAPEWGTQRVREYNFGKRNLLEVCGFRETVALTSLDPVDEMRLWREVSPQRMLRVMGTRYVITAPGHAARFGGRQVAVDPLWGFAVVELPDASPMVFRPEQ